MPKSIILFDLAGVVAAKILHSKDLAAKYSKQVGYGFKRQTPAACQGR
ncbi:hypothetical protein [Granulicella sp. S190]|nr:hypothetical protein [Granulicella sp. S190]